MSGGHFQYKQREIRDIADEIEQLIIDNDSEEKDQLGDRKGCHFSSDTIEEFKKALNVLRCAYVYAQRIDWLVSSDDSEDGFHERLKKELENLKNA